MAAFEAIATDHGFDVELPHSIIFQFLGYLPPSHGYTYHKPLLS